MKRFKIIHKEHLGGFIVRILLDTETGVQYLSHGGFSPSITPLLDKNGDIIVSGEFNRKE